MSQRPHIDQTGTPMIITPEILTKINDGAIRVFIFGFVEYSDDFGYSGWHGLFGKRITGFCVVYNPKNDPKFAMWDDCDNAKYIYAY